MTKVRYWKCYILRHTLIPSIIREKSKVTTRNSKKVRDALGTLFDKSCAFRNSNYGLQKFKISFWFEKPLIKMILFSKEEKFGMLEGFILSRRNYFDAGRI